MRYVAFILGLLVLFVFLLIAMLSFAPPIHTPAQQIQYLIAGLVIVPVLFAFIGSMVVFTHGGAFHYQPITGYEPQQDQINHIAIGYAQAFAHDYSAGGINDASIYTPEVTAQMQALFHDLLVYRDRGWQFVFAFYHNEHFRSHVTHELSEYEQVVEIDGAFDFYVSRNGEQRFSPYPAHRTDPMIQEEGIIRLRLIRVSEQVNWRIAGYADSISGIQLGLPVA